MLVDIAAVTKSEGSYVETIERLISTHGYARVTDIAAMLYLKPPSVTNMLQKLDQQGYVKYTRYRGVTLTQKGKRLANILRKRHAALKAFFVMIGVSEATAEKDACEIEHKIHPKSIEKLASFLEFLTTFPQTPHLLKSFQLYSNKEK